MAHVFNVQELQGKPCDIDDPKAAAYFRGAIEHYINTRGLFNPTLRARVQELESAADFAQISKLVTGSILAPGENPDEGYKLLFDFQDHTRTQSTGFVAHDIQSGLTWEQYAPGQKIKMRKITGTDITLNWLLYSCGHNFNKVDFKNGQWYTLEQEAKMFALGYYTAKAQYFYGLLEGTSKTVAWQGAEGDPVVSRDAQTINAAVAAIISALKGYGVSSKNLFYVVCPDAGAVKSRVLAALNIQRAWTNNSELAQVDYRVEPLFTTHLSASTNYYVVLPKLKLLAGERQLMELSGPVEDVTRAGGVLTVVGNAQWVGIVGDENQVQRCAIS